MTFTVLLVVALVFMTMTVSGQTTPVLHGVSVTPGFARVNLLRGTTAANSQTVFSEEAAPLKIVRVESSAPWIKATFRKAADKERVAMGRSEQAQYLIDISVDGIDAKAGPIAEFVTVVTNSPTRAEIRIPVSGVVRSPYRVDPTGINFLIVSFSDTHATRTITLRSNDLARPADFVVSKVVSDLAAILTTSLAPTDKPGEYQVTVQIRKDAPPGSFGGVVQIHTNSKYPAVYEIPVKGTIVKK